MPQEPAIINTTVIQVKSTTKDTYGNLIVTPMEGEDVKISEKRQGLFNIFQPGIMVKLFWAEYMQKKYVARAELPDKTSRPPESQMSGTKGTSKDRVPGKDDGDRIRSMAIAYAKDLVVAGKIDKEALITWATVIEAYIDGDYKVSQDEIIIKFAQMYGKYKKGA